MDGQNLIPGVLLSFEDWPHSMVPEVLPNPGEILLTANRFYQRPAHASVPALQLSYDDKAGRFPWEEGYAAPRTSSPAPGPGRRDRRVETVRPRARSGSGRVGERSRRSSRESGHGRARSRLPSTVTTCTPSSVDPRRTAATALRRASDVVGGDAEPVAAGDREVHPERSVAGVPTRTRRRRPTRSCAAPPSGRRRAATSSRSPITAGTRRRWSASHTSTPIAPCDPVAVRHGQVEHVGEQLRLGQRSVRPVIRQVFESHAAIVATNRDPACRVVHRSRDEHVRTRELSRPDDVRPEDTDPTRRPGPRRRPGRRAAAGRGRCGRSARAGRDDAASTALLEGRPGLHRPYARTTRAGSRCRPARRRCCEPRRPP